MTATINVNGSEITFDGEDCEVLGKVSKLYYKASETDEPFEVVDVQMTSDEQLKAFLFILDGVH